MGGDGSNTQPAASHPSGQQRKHLAAVPLPLSQAGQDIPHLEEGKPRQLHSAEPPENLEETRITAGGDLGEDPDCPPLPTHPGRLLLSALQLAGQPDGGQRGDGSQ